MPLEVGSRLGHYDVTAKVGEDGMGEVYRARDTKLDRDVALKVLPGRYSLFPGFPGRLYDIDPSGERLLVGQSPVARSELAFVLNWDKELERLIPTE